MPEQHSRLLKKLSILYPNPRSELFFQNPYELLVAVMLSAQCTDKLVNKVTPGLFSKYKDFSALSKARLTDVEKTINAVNYYKTKAKNLIAMAKLVVEKHNSSLPMSHSELIQLPGVGNKTANVVCSELEIEPALPVDTHVFRVSRRLGFSDGKNVTQVENDLKKIFHKNIWRNLHHWLILHGRRVCKAQNPRCDECAINSFCKNKNMQF